MASSHSAKNCFTPRKALSNLIAFKAAFSERPSQHLSFFILAIIAVIGVMLSIDAAAQQGSYYIFWPYGDVSKIAYGSTPQEICQKRIAEMRGIEPYPLGGWCPAISETAIGLNASGQCSITYLFQPLPGCSWNNGSSAVIDYPMFTPQYATCNEINGWIPSIPRPFQCGGPGYFLSALPSKKLEPAMSCNLVGEPINPATGGVVKSEGDCGATRKGVGPSFARTYDSVDAATGNLGAGWRGSFSRQVKSNTVITGITIHSTTNPDHSAQFGDPASACLSGFAQIQNRVASWAGSTSVYENSLCKLIKDGRIIAWLPIHQSSGVPMASLNPVSYDVIQDDGQLIRFWNQGGVLRSSDGVLLRLQQTASGFELRDTNDSVERYDTNGRLLSITSRAGVVQTMAYDGSGRLSTVTDSFGHQLILTYDSQNRVQSVTRQ